MSLISAIVALAPSIPAIAARVSKEKSKRQVELKALAAEALALRQELAQLRDQHARADRELAELRAQFSQRVHQERLEAFNESLITGHPFYRNQPSEQIAQHDALAQQAAYCQQQMAQAMQNQAYYQGLPSVGLQQGLAARFPDCAPGRSRLLAP